MVSSLSSGCRKDNIYIYNYIYIYMFEKNIFIEMWADVFFEKLCLYYLKVFSEDRQVEPLDGCTTFLKEHRIH